MTQMPPDPVPGTGWTGSAWTPPPSGPPSAPPPPPDHPGTPRPHFRGRELAVVAAVAALIGGGIGAGTVVLSGSGSDGASSGLALGTGTAPQPKLDGSIPAAAARIEPSVVTIDVTGQQQADTGSGVIIRTGGNGSYVLTNNHVIAAANPGGTITVELADGRHAPAKVVGADVSDDLAVVKIDLANLTPATFAPSSTLVVGQSVVAVGAPLGLSATVTSGIVSNTARPVQTGDSANSQSVFDAVQTDAAINPGNSGGPLVNLNGDVVGINAAIATAGSGGLQLPGQSQPGSIGIGFAIPSDEAARIAGQLIASGHATHALLGVSVANAQQGGAAVKTVTGGGPAATAGLQPGDVITALDTQRIDAADGLVAAVRSHAPGQKVRLTYQRGGSSHTATVTLGTSSS